MNTALVGSEAVDLLSRITGQKLCKQALTPPVIFLAALLLLLLGVIFVDGTVTVQKKQRLKTIVNRLVPSGSNFRQLGQLMTQGIQQQQVHQKLNELLVLTAPLSESERLLLISFGYQMAAVDGENVREKGYLYLIANRLEIDPRYQTVLEARFIGQKTVESAALYKVSSLLDPIQFQYLDSLFVNAASYIIETLPNRPKAQNTQQHEALFYLKLKELQNSRKQLDIFCYQLYQFFQECYNHGLEIHSFLEELTQLSKKSQCYQFQSLENSLGIEICYLEIQQFRTKIKDLIQVALDKFHQIEHVLNEQIKFLEIQNFLENYKIFEIIGETSGRELKVRCLGDKVAIQVVEQTDIFWDEWFQGLFERIKNKSSNWPSFSSVRWKTRKNMQEHYKNQFLQELKTELDDWQAKVLNFALKLNLEKFDKQIQMELKNLNYEVNLLEIKQNSSLDTQINADNFNKTQQIISLMPLACLGVTIASGILVSSMGFASPWVFGTFRVIQASFKYLEEVEIKQKIIELCMKEFTESTEINKNKVHIFINSVFHERVESANQVIAQAIALYENLLEQQEEAHQETLEQRETKKAFISHKRQELECLQRNLEAILEESAGEFALLSLLV